jgi:hypothetical protein
VLVAVGVEDHRAAAGHLLEAVGVQLGLLLTDLRILLGALRLDDGQRKAVGSPEHVVDEPVARAAARDRHPDDGELAVAYVVQQPSGLGEEHVEEAVAGLRLVVVVVVDAAFLLDGRDLLAQPCGLHFVCLDQVVALGELALVGFVLSTELLGEADDVVAGEGRGRSGESRVELSSGRHGLSARRVAVGRPHDHMEELAQGIDRGPRRHGSSLVHGEVAELADQGELLCHTGPGEVAEGGVADPGGQVVAVGLGQPRHVVHVADQLLDGATRVEAGGARVADEVALGPGTVGVEVRPLCLDEVEVARHDAPCAWSGLIITRPRVQREDFRLRGAARGCRCCRRGRARRAGRATGRCPGRAA